jgi:trimethylamine:corrinoid methyltransferase-like protein
VPPPLQPVLQYWIAASFSRQGRAPVDPKSEETFPHVAEMAQVLGHPLRHLPVYVFSPLNLGGESLRCAVKYRDRLDAVGVCSMPSPGCTTPVRLGDALAVASAEVIGPVILLRELLGLPVHWHVSVFPIDLRHMAMVFGSPESLLFEWAGRELTAHYQGTQWLPWADNMHTNAKLPGAQASAERSSLMVQGALLGARHFGAAGTLSLDEAFSAEQLLYDLEVKDHCERLVQGLDPACDPERCLAEVQAGLEAGGFAALDATLDGYRDLYWHPRLFDRDFVGAWQARGAPTARARAQEMVAQLTAGHDFELDSGLQDALDAILESAGAHFGARLRAPQPLD